MTKRRFIPSAGGATLERRELLVTIAVLGSGTAPVGILAGHVLPGFSLVEPGQPGNVDTYGYDTATATVALRQALKFDPDAKILPIVIADTRGRTDTILMSRGIWDAVAAGADVVSISISSVSRLRDRIIWPFRVSPDSPTMRFANGRNVPVVVTAGNTGNNNDVTPVWPASDGGIRRLPNVFSVTATDDAGNLNPLSNRGRRSVTLGAPDDVLATLPDGREIEGYGSGFASARVAGVIAGIRHVRPEESIRNIRADIRAAVTRTPSMLLATRFGGSLLADTIPPQVFPRFRPAVFPTRPHHL